MTILISRLMNWRVVRYLISGGSAAVTNLLVLFVLVHFFRVWYLSSAVIAFLVAVFISFLMQKFFTFNDYSKEKIRGQTILYFMAQVFNLGFNTLFMYVCVDIFGVHYIFSQVLVGAAMAFYTFFIYKHVVFMPDIIYNTAHDDRVPILRKNRE